ncbi:HSP20-like chaperone [Lentinula edodes]|uniref:HSP20-like chaperone n=1 Tax=Lentinula edodes TaxID=5353 RepID=UPI001E8DEFDA|nr:HSP20-like chaperone [Lentinula edodes]KAH7869538.1 HSP20-like chaperone [Lentinula edodes]
MAPTRTANIRSSRIPSRGRSPDDDVVNQIVAERLKALLKANRIRFVNPSSGMFRPRCDVFDDLSSSIVTAMFELPGVKRSEIALNLREGALVVQGERVRPDKKYTNQPSYSRFPAPLESTATTANESELKHRYVLEELRYGKFERRITLPDGIKDADIKAHMSEGILIVTWPRQPTSQGSSTSVPFASSK